MSCSYFIILLHGILYMMYQLHYMLHKAYDVMYQLRYMFA